MIQRWINARMNERTSWDGAVIIGAAVVYLILAPIADLVAYATLAYGAWTLWKPE